MVTWALSSRNDLPDSRMLLGYVCVSSHSILHYRVEILGAGEVVRDWRGIPLLDWGGCSVVRSPLTSRGPEFKSQHSLQAAWTCLSLQLQESSTPFCLQRDTQTCNIHSDTHIHINANKLKKIEKTEHILFLQRSRVQFPSWHSAAHNLLCLQFQRIWCFWPPWALTAHAHTLFSFKTRNVDFWSLMLAFLRIFSNSHLPNSGMNWTQRWADCGFARDPCVVWMITKPYCWKLKTMLLKLRNTLLAGWRVNGVVCFLEAYCDLYNIIYLLLSSSGTELGIWQTLPPVFINFIYEHSIIFYSSLGQRNLYLVQCLDVGGGRGSWIWNEAAVPPPRSVFLSVELHWLGCCLAGGQPRP